jgi:hypothetical protein
MTQKKFEHMIDEFAKKRLKSKILKMYKSTIFFINIMHYILLSSVPSVFIVIKYYYNFSL